MRTVRNVAIIMLLAIPVAFTATGGNLADALFTALIMGMLAGFAWAVYVFSRENQLTLATLTDSRRALLYGAIGLILLLIAGTDKLFATGGGTLLWIVLLAAAVAAIWKVWMDANTYN